MYEIVCKYERTEKRYVAWVAGDRDEYYGYGYGATASEAIAEVRGAIGFEDGE
jgi:hypothetical protein